MRLDKLLSQNGFTRSEAKKVVAAGRVRVNDAAAKDSGLQVKETDTVLLDGRPIGERKELYLMLYKPEGYITATEDARQQTVFDLVPKQYHVKDLCAVGRLDKDTTGLLFLTTDGAMAHFLISPKKEIEKVYQATVEGKLLPSDIEKMARGVHLKDFDAKPAKMEILSAEDAQSVALLTVTEGKYHQVKRMFQAIGHTVTALHRQSIGGIMLDGNLSKGEIRELTPQEIAHCKALCGMEDA